MSRPQQINDDKCILLIFDLIQTKIVEKVLEMKVYEKHGGDFLWGQPMTLIDKSICRVNIYNFKLQQKLHGCDKVIYNVSVPKYKMKIASKNLQLMLFLTYISLHKRSSYILLVVYW